MSSVFEIPSRWKPWVPGMLFLLIQVVNSFYELTQPWRRLSWSPHTVQISYTLKAYENGQEWDDGRIFEVFDLAPSGWEHHNLGNLKGALERTIYGNGARPDSAVLTYSVNGRPFRTESFKAAGKRP